MRHLFSILIMLLSCAFAADAGNLYLNIIWHQHQPLYVDPETDQLRGPWVRTHATKDYYDMAAMHKNFPEIHATINLTSSLLLQLQRYYVDRLSSYVYDQFESKHSFDAETYFEQSIGKTDPWIDLALKSSSEFTAEDVNKLVNEPWNAFGISDIQLALFPEYQALRDKPRDSLTTDDYTQIKCWFFLAHFDPDFLRGKAKLDRDVTVDLSDLAREEDGRFYLRRPFTEADAKRLVADAVLVMMYVVPAHSELLYDPKTHRGQLEIITTPFYHPILPLLIDSDVARVCQTRDSLPSRFAYPADAQAQVVKGVDYFRSTFGVSPRGMWPAEGSISEDAAGVFATAGVKWICGDMHVLDRSLPDDLEIAQPYRLSTPGGDIAIVFRETNLSDHIGFTYQRMQPQEGAQHFLDEALKFKPKENQPDRLLTVILDGENAWEWYEHDIDGKEFLHTLYQKLSIARVKGEITCVTPTEYFEGNSVRKIPAHPIAELTEIESLWPGSWINANYDTWIGEPEENAAWDLLLRTRRDLEATGLPQPDPHSTIPDSSVEREIWLAYESMYAAEGSDWFWWYGADQTAGAGDRPFEEAFFSHLRSVYRHAIAAGAQLTVPDMPPILSEAKVGLQEGGGVMAQGQQTRRVLFVCDAAAQDVSQGIFIVGNHNALGNWVPNRIALFDDGTHGDEEKKDGLWSLELEFPLGSEIQYKYTNSGQLGVWQPSEEFPQSNRSFTVESDSSDLLLIRNVFGVRD